MTITFFLANQIPGDPVEIMLGPSPAQGQVDAIRARYGLDRPAYQRFLTYLAGVVTGDLGQSIYYDRPVLEMILLRLPVTLYLTVSAFLFAIVTAIPLGVISAKRRNKPADHVSRIVSLIGVSTPSFWIGLMLIIVFAFHLGWFPARGLPLPWASPAEIRGAETQLQVVRTSLHHLAMPMVALGTLQMAQITRIERSSMVESLQGEYVRLARAYGVSESKIARKHAFQVAQLPVITIIGLGLSTALGGAVLTETVFEIPGMGRLIITAINNQDYELIMGTTFMFGVAFVVGVIVTDIAYAYIDPRVAYGEET
ncbi:ABC transporter permease [Halorubrum sp. BOL3-1]|uniref:ABC transporter permease n=1 Tax=Halorubrum sp. BOL3-1 TaxID=2497325 RepID=UPI0010051E3A|nr:ABC transporter permease [Halorubrum sp. BOL3-1]QAU14394.1 ABC transporter permease [Halorubrum sp. BOL3-1]